jgi:hypothetical protein
MFYYSKKKIKNDMRKGVFAGLALALILIACDKELPGNTSGREVTVRVRLAGIAGGGEETLTRSSSMKETESITPVGEGMLLEMRMERNTLALRANKTQLDPTSLFRVVALKHNTTTFISYGDFTGDGTPVAGDLHVPINDSYDFVCYSYDSTTLPSLNSSYEQDATISDSETIPVLQGTKDLLWTKMKVDVNDEAPELEILLSRVMVRVKVVIDLSYNKWTISSVPGSITLGSVNSGGTIQLTDGTAASTGTPTFSSWTGSGYQRESELLVMPKASGTITVSIPKDAIARQSLSTVPASAASATFTSELKPGYSYKLLVRLRIPIFARSNIYWDGTAGELTFERADGVTDYEGYQGVFFKWGSLVGISPVGSFGSSTPVYEPKAIVTGDYSWGEIPYWNSDTDVGDPDISTLNGDICKYIDSDYRLPLVGEFGTGMGWDQQGWEWDGDFGDITTDKDDGTYDFIANGKTYAKNTAMGDVIFPASGQRQENSALGTVGSFGSYWKSPVSGTTGGTCMTFLSSAFMPYSAYDRRRALPIRCVQN